MTPKTFLVYKSKDFPCEPSFSQMILSSVRDRKIFRALRYIDNSKHPSNFTTYISLEGFKNGDISRYLFRFSLWLY